MIPLLPSDGSLRFALPWPGTSQPLQLLLLAAVLLAAFAIALRIYRMELRQLPRRAARLLLALRLLTAFAILGILFTDPALVRSRTETIPGRIIVAIDTSDSMRIADVHRPNAEKLRLARRLKLAGDLAGDGELESWTAIADAPSPRFLSEGERNRFLAVIERVDAMTRLDFCQRILTPQGMNLLGSLREKHSLDLVGFCPEVQPLPPDAEKLAKLLGGSTGDRHAVITTDLKLPLQYAAQSKRGDAEDVLGVILLTDGRHNWGPGPMDSARELGRRGIPICSISIAPQSAPPDVAVFAVSAAASTVFKGSTVPVEATVRATNWPAGAIHVTLAGDGDGQKISERVIDHPGGDGTYSIELKAKFDEAGPQRLTLRADAGPADRFPDNNQRSVRVNVVKDRARLMLIDGEARWEFHYLHTCLGRDPNMDVRSVVFRQPRLGMVAEAELRSMGVPATRLPDRDEVLSTYDAIVLGDVEPQQLNAADRLRLERYVADSGGTLIISAGKRAMPQAYEAVDDPIRKLLPIREPGEYGSTDGFNLALTPDGTRSWFLSLADFGGGSPAVWQNLPRHFWAVTGSPKDAATVLAVGPGDRPIIVRQNYGLGRVVFVGIDSTWRWRFKVGDLYHHRFWGQLAQWAASDRLLPIANAAGTIRFGTREPIYDGGQSVEIVVRTDDRIRPLKPEEAKNARIIRLPSTAEGAERIAALVPLASADGRPHDLGARISDLIPGRYAVELDIPAWAGELIGPPGPDGRAAPLRCHFEIVPADQDELFTLSGDWAMLEELAKPGSGLAVTMENAATLAEFFEARSATRTVTDERPFRKTWTLLSLLLLMLAAEWVVRKWHGLP